MNKKHIILVIVSIILVIGIYFGYKGFCLYLYSTNAYSDYEELINGLTIKDTITIKTQNTTDYLTFGDIKIRNDFKKFKKQDNDVKDFDRYTLNTFSSRAITYFGMGTGMTYVDMLKADKTYFSDNGNSLGDFDFEKFLKKNNINNDIELFEYLLENKDIKNNIFTSTKKMKESYNIKNFASVALPLLNNITIINGDYVGYIFNTDKYKEVSILKNNIRYIFVFMDTYYFTDDVIKDLLNTVIIENEEEIKNQMIMVNDKLYYNTNKESEVEARCGNMDGYIDSTVSKGETPTINNQSNFGINYGYQYINETVEVAMRGKFMVFKEK